MFAPMKRCFPSQGPLYNRFASVFFLWTIVAMGILLTGCASVEQRQANVLNRLDGIADTASGTLNGAKERVEDIVNTGKNVVEQGKATVDSAKQVVEDIDQRVKSVQAGVEKVREGKQLIEAGVKGGQ